MHAYFPPADAAAPAAAGAGEAADGSDQRTAALPAGAPAPPQAAASGPEVAMPSYQPWKQSRPELKGCTAEQWAASRCKTDDYIAPTMPKGSAPGKMWSFGVCQKGAAVGTKQWRCLCPTAGPRGTVVPCGKILTFPDNGNIWSSCANPLPADGPTHTPFQIACLRRPPTPLTSCGLVGTSGTSTQRCSTTPITRLRSEALRRRRRVVVCVWVGGGALKVGVWEVNECSEC